ncbi:MAG: formylglycine-generating enzyme family protein [Bacteroidia bacterium]
MRRLYLSLFLFFGFVAGYANNIQVSNVTLTGQNTAANTYQVQFDISWENSWRTSTFESNYDAAWVFVKYRIDPNTNWQHATMNAAGFVAPGGATVDIAADATGAFIFRSGDGIGNVNFTGVELRWNYGGIPDDAILEICVQAIEMVYIPGGSFELGDDSPTPVGNFEAGVSTNPFPITSENGFTLGGNSVANLNNNNGTGMGTQDDYNNFTTQTLPAAYPKGFNPYYIQKYEMSHAQYAAFLNKLTPAAAANRFPGQNGNNNHTLTDSGAPPETYVTTTPDRAINYLSWADVAAYADWTGLRPMTELEYEKASRGSRPSTPDEYAWGNPFVYNVPYNIANAGLANETIINPGTGTGNAIYTETHPTPTGPRRCGILSASAGTASRQETGATYYGVMEMSGNAWEITVTTGHPTGRAFNANHGNGIIGVNSGNSTVVGWPAISGGSFGLGIGLRGGGFSNQASDLRTSNRRLAAFPVTARFSDVSGRLVKSNF